jgi:hypothetical protein
MTKYVEKFLTNAALIEMESLETNLRSPKQGMRHITQMLPMLTYLTVEICTGRVTGDKRWRLYQAGSAITVLE